MSNTPKMPLFKAEIGQIWVILDKKGIMLLREVIEQVQRDTARIDEVSWRKALGTAALAGTLLTGNPQMVQAHSFHQHYHQNAHHHRGLPSRQYTEQEIINTIVGEASDQGYKGMLAVADAIRNRAKNSYYMNNILYGAYGRRARHIRHESAATFNLAKQAWNESATKDITSGAYLWFSDSDIRKVQNETWFQNLEPTMSTSGKWGRQTFFRDKVK